MLGMSLLDMNVPDMLRLEVVRVFSNRLADSPCHMILLTAERFSIGVIKAMNLGAREQWPKPLSVGRPHSSLRALQGERIGSARNP